MAGAEPKGAGASREGAPAKEDEGFDLDRGSSGGAAAHAGRRLPRTDPLPPPRRSGPEGGCGRPWILASRVAVLREAGSLGCSSPTGLAHLLPPHVPGELAD